MARPEVVKTELGKRLRELRGDLDRDTWAAQLGFGKTTIANYERGDRKPDGDFLEALVEHRNVDLNALFGRQGEPEGGPDPDVPVAFIDRFQLRASAGAGSADVAVPAEPMAFGADWLRRHGIRPADVSVLEVRGDSMFPLLHDGDPIIVSKRKSRPVDGQVYVVVRPDLVQVKKVLTLQRRFELISENPDYPAERIDFRESPEPAFYRVRGHVHFLG